ncbi:T9SS type A sorting domain-containing protein [Fluviicola chungangensis]|uniref:T9SS type A sorting domain-containing protein n=1 Tax=Fluviicola chungangensis TaxID=2597671 RepID=A0A556N0N1_9FLAO|nr:T9SS type A sorting domain-containing protein [Fluviicola chungangensis]TSJ45588.1 T9SS type A sorting domain-containing protein [Fluviicola chungangensis]
MKKLTTFKMRNRSASRNLVLGLMLSMGSLLAFGQTITTSIGTGTNTSSNIPITSYYGYSYSQQIYLASEMDPGVQGQLNSITKIRFYYASGSVTNSDNWTIYMGSTNQTSFSSNTNWIPSTAMSQVFSGTVTFPAAGNWMEITLTTPFQWNGLSNVVIAVDENQGSYSASDGYWRSQSTSGTRAIFYRNDSTNPDPASPPTATGLISAVSQVQIVHELAPACSAAPDHATAVSSVSTICSNSPTPVNLSITGSTFATGLGYQWQYNDGSGWVDYPAGTTQDFSVFPQQTVNVHLITTCIATGDEDISEEASISVNPAPTVAADNAALAYCSGSPAQVVATGASTYAWSPATGLNVTNNDTVIANPTNSTVYSVVGTDIMGCKDTAMVTITPINKITRTATYSPTTLCTPGTAVTVTATAAPATIFGGGAYEYKFMDANGAVLQDWSASSTYNFTPAADSIYKIYADFRSNTCPDAIDSISTSIVVGFGANVAVVDYDCINLGGTVTLSSIFGQTNTETVYTNPFAAPTDVTAGIVTLGGSAAITAGRAVLTPSATGINGSLTINDPAFHTGLNNAMTVSFKMTADQPINNYGTGGADGISYSFGNDVTATGNQNGTGSKLRLSFDANDNSPNIAGIYLGYNVTGTLSPAGAGTLIHVGNIALWKLKQDVPVVLTIDPNGKASLTVDGTTVFENVQMPAAYMNANTAGWKHVFGAATGGDAMRQAIKDVLITAPSLDFAFVPATTTPTAWGSASTFTNVQPGTYDVWISSNGSASCAKKIETVEIVNTNPLVLLGNDTTICEGESLTLDAGNAGATYVWSNSQITTQTRIVTQPGPYVVNVTAPNGCVGVGSINVDVMGAPTASTIYVQNNMPTYTFTILNPQNANQYSWDFGDGTTIANAPGTVSHTYLTAGPRQVSVTLTNECGTETVIATVVVTSTAGLETNAIDGLNVYPNPANEFVTVELPSATQAIGSLFTMAGSLVRTIDSFTAKTEVSVADLTPGVYFLHIQSEDKTSVIKLVVE